MWTSPAAVSFVLFSAFVIQDLAAPVESNFTTDPFREGSNVTYPLPAHLIYDFPTATWIENIAVRSNGQLLVTEETAPRLYQVDPFNPKDAVLVHEFSETGGALLGIAETSPDIFYVCAANATAARLGISEQQHVFRVDLRAFSPEKPGSAEVSRITTVPQARLLNGLLSLGPESNLLLVSDSSVGAIFSINIETGESRVVINSTYTQPVTMFGVNGLKLFNESLYFTNTDQGILVKVPINDQGEAVGPFVVVARGSIFPDDFTIDADGDAYITSAETGANGLLFVPREGGVITQLAGMSGPTAAAFGRTRADRDVLYVVTSGGDFEYSSGEPVTVSGKILKIDVGRQGLRS